MYDRNNYGENLVVFSRWILQRWTYPLVPDQLSGIGDVRYRCHRSKVYLPIDNNTDTTIALLDRYLFGLAKFYIVIGRNLSIEYNAIIAPRTELKSNTVVKNVVIGCDTVIGMF